MGCVGWMESWQDRDAAAAAAAADAAQGHRVVGSVSRSVGRSVGGRQAEPAPGDG
jgi:hypothetical protein